MKRWDSLVEGYMAECEQRGMSQEHLRGIGYELDRWGCWLKRRRPKPKLEEVDGPMLIDYLRRRTHFHAKATVATVASKLRCMGEYLVAQGVWGQNPMRWVRGPRLDPRGKLPRRIGAEHLKKIWEASGQQRSNYQQHLAVAMLSLLYGTGLRRGELERLNVADWNRQENLLKVDGRKSACERSIPLSEGIGRCLEAYLPLRQNLLEEHGNTAEPALLLNRNGQRLSAQSLGLIVHRLAQRAQVPLVSLHQFRHTCASDLLESGASLPEVQGVLGHKRVDTTCRYLLLDYTWRSGRCDRNVLDGLTLEDTPRPQAPKHLTIEQARQLIEACPARSQAERRDRLMLLLLYGCGLRTGELCRLDRRDVDLERQELVVQGKGERRRRVPVPEAVWTVLLAYLVERKGRTGALLRTLDKGVRLSSADVCEVVSAAARRAGLPEGVTPKTLRHSYATHLMDRGVDVAVIASLMGHRSAHETGVYLHRLPGRAEAAVELLKREPNKP